MTKNELVKINKKELEKLEHIKYAAIALLDYVKKRSLIDKEAMDILLKWDTRRDINGCCDKRREKV